MRDYEVVEEQNEMQKLRLPGWVDGTTWSAFEKVIVDNDVYYILENDKYGDEVYSLVINKNKEIVCSTYDDIVTALEDEGIL